MDTSTGTLKQKAYHELKEYLVITLYLWVIFVLLELHKSVVLGERYIDIARQSFAIINALALGKVMLIARDLHLGEVVHDTSLIYPTLLKSALFSLLLAAFKILEDAAVGLYHGRSFSQSIEDLGGGTWRGIFSLTAIVFVVLIPFFAFTELERVLGEGRLEQLFFRRRKL
ncbi:MAG: hypothetical protein JOY54_18870 [Acidobacteriaceae bacterium]|nr:hypothetical protein [Acidobacteriaceae bacterium]